MSNEKAETKKDQITMTIEQVQGLVSKFMPYYPIVKWGTRLMGVKIPPEIDEAITAIQKGEMPNLEKLRALESQVAPRVGDPVLTRDLAYQAWMLHRKEGMGTREIADYFTNELNSPCSHATVARYVNMVDAEMQASKMGKIIRIAKYAGIVGICLLSAYIGHLLW